MGLVVTEAMVERALAMGACAVPAVGVKLVDLAPKQLEWAAAMLPDDFALIGDGLRGAQTFSGSGSGDGYGSGSGYGSGDGYGSGSGYGYGSGSGSGDGYGSGSGYGDGSGSGYGDGSGDGSKATLDIVPQ